MKLDSELGHPALEPGAMLGPPTEAERAEERARKELARKVGGPAGSQGPPSSHSGLTRRKDCNLAAAPPPPSHSSSPDERKGRRRWRARRRHRAPRFPRCRAQPAALRARPLPQGCRGEVVGLG